MSPKQYTRSYNEGSGVVKIRYQKIQRNLWNVCMVHAPSTRVANDFLHGHYRRRGPAKLLAKPQGVSLRTLARINRFNRWVLETIPKHHWCQIRADYDKVSVLAKHMRRLGYRPYQVEGIGIIYFAKALPCQATSDH